MLELRPRGINHRMSRQARVLLSNTLASFILTPCMYYFSHSLLVSDQQVEEWSIFTGCDSSHCMTSRNGCGDEEGFVLRVLCEWNQDLCIQLFTSLITRLYVRRSAYPLADTCPHTFLFVLDTLMQRQRTHLTIPSDELTLLPIHALAYKLLNPMLQLAQQAMQQTEASIRYLYHRDNDRNQHYFGDTPRQPHKDSDELNVDVTTWMVFESRMLLMLLNFLDVDAELQERLTRRLATTEQKMKRWLWDGKNKCFGDFGDDELKCHIGYGSVLSFALDLIGIGNVRIDDHLCHLLNKDEVGENEISEL